MGFPVVMYRYESWTKKKAEHWRIDAFKLWCWRTLFRVPWTTRRSNQSILRKSVLNIHWKDWFWSWSANTLATQCEEPVHWKRPWCWERLKVGEGDDRGWDGWMASPTWWTWVWVGPRSWWWTWKPGVLQSMGSQRIGHDWATELNRTEPLRRHVPILRKLYFGGSFPGGSSGKESSCWCRRFRFHPWVRKIP